MRFELGPIITPDSRYGILILGLDHVIGDDQ